MECLLDRESGPPQQGPLGIVSLTKGGAVKALGHNERSYRCAYQSDEYEGYSDKALSFRCCLSEE